METAKGSKNGASTNGFRYSFDSFEVDPANRMLLRDGEPVALTSKVFDILLVFAENPGRLLEKNELIEKVWATEFVEEGNLARNVSTLRKALGDTGKDHKYITTVQGHGYRFVADVHRSNGSVAEPKIQNDLAAETYNAEKSTPELNDVPVAPQVVQKIPIHDHLYKRPILLSMAALVLVASTLIAFRFGGPKPRLVDTLSFDKIRRTRLTQDGNVGGAVISPDGQYLAYWHIQDTDKGLAVRQVSTGSVLELEPIRSGATYWALAFAPDNSFLYYIERDPEVDYGSLYRIPLLGGQRHKLLSYADGGLAVSPDGRKLGFTSIDREKGTSSIVIAEADGSNERSLSSVDLDSMFYSLDWAPDGNGLIYSLKRHDETRDYWYLVEIATSDGTERRIGDSSDSTIVAAKWLADKSGIIVNAIDDATRQPQLYTISYPDGAKHRITNDLNSYYGFTMTADARSIVVPEIYANRQIWDIPAAQMNNAVQISNGVETHFDSVSWAGDDYLVFDRAESNSFGGFNIYRCKPDGSAVEQLTFGDANNSEPAISPDGRTIAFVSSRTGTGQLWRMNIDGQDAMQLTELPENVDRPVFSADGQRIFFSMMVAGKRNLWQVPTIGGEAKVTVDADIYHWAVAPGGDLLAYTVFDRDSKAERTHIHSIAGNDPDRVLDIAPETWMEWSKDGKALYFNTGKDGAQNIWEQSLDGSAAPRPVTSFNSEQVFRFAWSPSGKELACIRHTTVFDALLLRSD